MYAERINKIRTKDPPDITGLDFVVVDPGQTTLRVHFIRNPVELVPAFTAPALDKITIVSTTGGESLASVEVTDADLVTDAGVMTLVLTTATPGDFSRYRLTIDDPRLDILFRSVTFTFKANCPDSNLDCKPITEHCAPEDSVDYPVDYMARDFLSLRGALLAYAAQRYPDWRETIEADQGVMLLELLAALGDELSYTQDRIAREAYLATATQRRSVRRHGHLVDYNLHDGRSASTWLDVRVKTGPPPADEIVAPAASYILPAHTRVWAVADDGETIPFETGAGLGDPATFTAVKAWNELPAHPFDPEQTLPAGTTELWIEDPDGVIAPPNSWDGKWIVIYSDPADLTKPRRRHLVQILHATPDEDPLDPIGDPPEPKPLVHITWDASQALHPRGRHLAPRHRLPARHHRPRLRPLRLRLRRRLHHPLRRRRLRHPARRRHPVPLHIPHRPGLPRQRRRRHHRPF
jgi:hypothetical protein